MTLGDLLAKIVKSRKLWLRTMALPSALFGTVAFQTLPDEVPAAVLASWVGEN